MRFKNIHTMLEGLHSDNGAIPLDTLEDKLNYLTVEELYDFGSMNSAEPQWAELADKAELTLHERGIITGIMECAFGECVDHTGKISL